MLFAALEFGDYFFIFLIVSIAGGGSAASAYLRPRDRGGLRQIEQKLDLILAHLGIDEIPPSKAEWQEHADLGEKVNAIKAYRQQHGVALLEAKKAVEDYIQGNRASPGADLFAEP